MYIIFFLDNQVDYENINMKLSVECNVNKLQTETDQSEWIYKILDCDNNEVRKHLTVYKENLYCIYKFIIYLQVEGIFLSKHIKWPSI